MSDNDLFDYENERPFYCEEARQNCPFDSRFRYCCCCELNVQLDQAVLFPEVTE